MFKIKPSEFTAYLSPLRRDFAGEGLRRRPSRDFFFVYTNGFYFIVEALNVLRMVQGIRGSATEVFLTTDELK